MVPTPTIPGNSDKSATLPGAAGLLVPPLVEAKRLLKEVEVGEQISMPLKGHGNEADFLG